MVMLPPAVRVFVALEPADLRRGFDGLAALTRERLGHDPFSGHLFVFWNRRRNRVKVLFWDRNGYALWYKRLERGRFRFACSDDGRCVEVEASELVLLLEGIELRGARRRPRFVPQRAAV